MRIQLRQWSGESSVVNVEATDELLWLAILASTKFLTTTQRRTPQLPIAHPRLHTVLPSAWRIIAYT
jgi:hypothetical protein